MEYLLLAAGRDELGRPFFVAHHELHFRAQGVSVELKRFFAPPVEEKVGLSIHEKIF